MFAHHSVAHFETTLPTHSAIKLMVLRPGNASAVCQPLRVSACVAQKSKPSQIDLPSGHRASCTHPGSCIKSMHHAVLGSSEYRTLFVLSRQIPQRLPDSCPDNKVYADSRSQPRIPFARVQPASHVSRASVVFGELTHRWSMPCSSRSQSDSFTTIDALAVATVVGPLHVVELRIGGNGPCVVIGVSVGALKHAVAAESSGSRFTKISRSE